MEALGKLIGYLAFIALVIYVAIKYWQYILAFTIVIIIIALILKQIKKRKTAIENEDSWRRSKQNQQSQLVSDLHQMSSNVKSLIGEIGASLSCANSSISNAESEFHDGAFSPFWDAIENAAISLYHINDKVKSLTNTIEKYKTKVSELEERDNIPELDSTIGSLANSIMAAADRFQNIVKTSQKNYRFSNIFEKRRNKTPLGTYSRLGDIVSSIHACLLRDTNRLPTR